MVLWRCQHLHWNWYYLYLPSKNIQFPKFYCWKSNNSLDHWEDNVYLQNLFLSNWFLFSTFSWQNTMKIPKISQGFKSNPTRLLPWTTWGAHSAPNPPADYSNCCAIIFSNSKKNRPANFFLFWPLMVVANLYIQEYNRRQNLD